MKQYTLPELPYGYGDLEPMCSAETMELHHSKHHAGYVKGANTALESIAEARSKNDYDHINGLTRDLAFNVAGHTLHSLFWESMAPDQDQQKADSILEAAVDRDFGSQDQLREQFWAAAKAVQGSGWVALSLEPRAETLMIHQIRDHHANLIPMAEPILLIDMWEHAYYAQYRNKKQEWIEAFWSLVCWEKASERFSTALNRTAIS